MDFTRRELLTTAGMASIGGIAGCMDISKGMSEFRLTSFELPNITSEFVVNPLDIESGYSVDYSDEYKQSRITELFETGTVSTRGWDVSELKEWGPIERDKRQVMVNDGTYYRIRVEESKPVERERWVFYFDWNVEAPSDDEAVVSPPLESLSPQDRKIVIEAEKALPRSDMRNGAEIGLNAYSAIFHDGIDIKASDLVPSPPFEYYHDGEYLRAVVGQRTIEKREKTYSAAPIAESESEYEKYARETFPDARFADISLSSDARDVLDKATSSESGSKYEEEPPLSDGLEEVLEHLTIAKHLKPHDEYEDRVYFRNALAKYDGRWQLFDLVIDP